MKTLGQIYIEAISGSFGTVTEKIELGCEAVRAEVLRQIEETYRPILKENAELRDENVRLKTLPQPVDVASAVLSRRYALLQAAVACYWAGYHENVDDWTYSQAVQETIKILAEIERR